MKFIGKILLLLAGTGLAVFSALTLVWRVRFCTMMMQLNAGAPPTDINSYLMRRIAQRRVCGIGDYFFNALGLFTGVLIAGTAWTLLKHKHRHAPQALTSSSVATPPNGR